MGTIDFCLSLALWLCNNRALWSFWWLWKSNFLFLLELASALIFVLIFVVGKLCKVPNLIVYQIMNRDPFCIRRIEMPEPKPRNMLWGRDHFPCSLSCSLLCLDTVCLVTVLWCLLYWGLCCLLIATRIADTKILTSHTVWHLVVSCLFYSIVSFWVMRFPLHVSYFH